MSTARLAGIVLAVIGLALVIFGIVASGAPVEEVRESLEHGATRDTIAYILGGIAALITGLLLVWVGRR